MNEERIDQIAFGAGCHRHKFWDPKHPDLEGFIISQAALDKFAELLIEDTVRKCADYAEYQLQIGGTNADKIKQHFGVE